MRKWISIVLVLSLVTMLTGVASAIEAGEDVALPLYTSSGEEKVYCNATVEDDFAENRIMVVLSNDASLQFNSYEAADFWEIDCTGVQDLSQASGRKIQAKAETVKAAVMTRSVDVSTLDTSGIDTYNQVLCLELEESGKENVLAAIDELMTRDDVVYAGPDYVLTLCSTTTQNPHDGHVDNSSYDMIDLTAAWDITTGSSNVVVGIIDTGIDAQHPDLVGKVNLSASYDFVTGRSGESIDLHGHGTHVAGIIGGMANNAMNICGVSPNVTLVSLRVFDENGTSHISLLIEAINFAETQGIPILNLSLGDFPRMGYQGNLEEIIENYEECIFVCAAGNESQDNDENDRFPCTFDSPNVIAVGASTSGDAIHYKSNYGETTVDLFAPGEYILSCYPTTKCQNLRHDVTRTTHCQDGYHHISGTSMATPYVTGVVALLLSVHPELSPTQLKETIIDTVDINTAFTGKCVSNGRLNAYRALIRGAIHDFSYVKYNHQKHTVTCDCGYSYLESHTWNATHTRCLTCGFNLNDPGLMYAVLNRERQENAL